MAFNAAVKIAIFEIYRKSGSKKKGIFGSRKIRDTINTYTINGKKVKLSRHQVLRIMKELGIKSKYNTKSFKLYANKEQASTFFNNLLNQQFDGYEPYEVLTSDLTYINTSSGWRYVCFIVDLFNREIVGYSISEYHDLQCVLDALASMQIDLSKVRIFHSDRGGELRSEELSKFMKKPNIKQSMSKAGCPYDNAVSENMFKLLKTEDVDKYYKYSETLIDDVHEWVKWYNHVRIHSKLNYVPLIIFRDQYKKQVI